MLLCHLASRLADFFKDSYVLFHAVFRVIHPLKRCFLVGSSHDLVRGRIGDRRHGIAVFVEFGERCVEKIGVGVGVGVVVVVLL